MIEFAFVKKLSNKHILKSTLSPHLQRRRSHTRSLSFSGSGRQADSRSLDNMEPSDFNVSIDNNNTDELSHEEEETAGQKLADWIDRRARIFFPISFLVFNLIFWTFVYLNI
ncbi:hypothetical protein ACLKA6_002133 [Drosophila palustris]